MEKINITFSDLFYFLSSNACDLVSVNTLSYRVKIQCTFHILSKYLVK